MSSPRSSCNSSYGSNSGQKLLNSANSSITSQVPGGVVTTQNISTVIRPRSNNNSLQFVRIQTPELSKKAVEQIRIVEETKISKDKIKENEEEWQNNLLQWKSKRRQQFNPTYEQEPSELSNLGDASLSGRKIKTFAEMMEERARSGNRLGFHLQRYMSATDDEDGQDGASLNKSNGASYINHDEQIIDHSKERADSDYEAHSSTSSGYKQPDSKSPSSPDTPLENLDISDSIDSHISRNTNLRGENRRQGERDHHSISLVDDPNSGQINSTLRPDVRSPSNYFKGCSILDVDTRNREISTKSEDESDNSAFEEDDEEEDEEAEQKHLQRIAFEAKLKAFEKLTKPSVRPVPPIAPKREVEPIRLPNKPHRSPLEPPPKHVHPPTQELPIPTQRAPYDDKDRTILSVSGKRRCSSCKEELGRGAAAFVVESLSLVYHTNCFRCSVCHVNLSNGFRGVDVRVHAGALHCQNCYSKDGLNYSRV